MLAPEVSTSPHTGKSGWSECHESPPRDPSQPHAKSGAEKRQHKGVEYHEPGERSPRGAERAPDGEGAFSRENTCKQQTRDVGGRHEKHEPNDSG